MEMTIKLGGTDWYRVWMGLFCSVSLKMDVASPLRLSAALQHSCQRLDDRSGYPQIAGQLLCEPLQGALSTSGKNVCFPFPSVNQNANHISDIFPGLYITGLFQYVFYRV